MRAQSPGSEAPTPNPAETPSEATRTTATTWNYNLSVSGYLVPDGGSYASPTLTVDHDWLHLEPRYNYEA